MNVEMKRAIEKAVAHAFAVHGVSGFKNTSLFMSNERYSQEVKQAA